MFFNLICFAEAAKEFTDPFASLPLELNYVLKILIGGVFGLALGFERSRRQKEAGMATHFVVGCASTLLTCVSLWFKEIGSDYNAAARIAAQIVSGVGFLGAGMIFFRRESLRGLTTAAGIWATAAIGMCVATGMFYLALGATALIILVQVVLHSRFIKRHKQHLLFVKMEYTEEIKESMREYFGFHNFHRLKVTASNETVMTEHIDENGETVLTEGKKLVAEAVIYPTKNCSAEEITFFLRENPQVVSIERLEDL
ncbi:MAG: MgtC/SapB family protein [Corallococcus sp.]|nr:MgtC/SapB family protein [Corallococcus sp.]MCM1359613.1 MgtC/SapB family protein [Corallococcus sp.]MCM1395205.1 MgtC/SapB family protein [Corallococcus sp.]